MIICDLKALRAEAKFGEDVHEILRWALLDEQIMAVGEEPLIVDLVMSTLNVTSTGVSRSSRPIIPLTTPQYLPARLVLDTWVKEYIPNISFSCGDSELKLLSLISCLSPLPRAVQLMVEVMRGTSVSPISMDALSIRILYLDTLNKVKLYYPKLEEVVLRPAFGKALLFGEKLPLDNEVMSLIADGVFTNAVENIGPDTTIIPQTSIIAMNLLPKTYYFSYEIRLMIDALLAFLQDSDEQKRNSGRPLEIVFNGLINSRLAVLLDVVREKKCVQEFTLLSLLRLERKTMKQTLSYELFDIMYGKQFVVSGTSYETKQLQFNSHSKCTFRVLLLATTPFASIIRDGLYREESSRWGY